MIFNRHQKSNSRSRAACMLDGYFVFACVVVVAFVIVRDVRSYVGGKDFTHD